MSDVPKESKDTLSRRSFLQASAGIAVTVTGTSNLAASVLDKEITHAKIFPGIGIARIGDSQDPEGFYIGPEFVEPGEYVKPEHVRDATGLKRQAARFRLYGYNAKGEVVRELTALDADIEWFVHLVNKKAAWYRFSAALDIPESAGVKDPRRNADVKGRARADLVVDGGKRSLKAKASARDIRKFDAGNFYGVAVSLGEMRVDSRGRLLVVGGPGKASSPSDAPIYNPQDEGTFNNADGWYDDIADGPVDATVKIGLRDIPVTGAWVAVAPPNYAPDIIGWRTLHDLLVDTYVKAGMMPAPKETSFTKDVLPLLQRLNGLQWVNKGIAMAHPRGSDADFDDPKLIKRLVDPKETTLRKKVYQSFRLPGANTSSKTLWPMLYGDSFGSSPADAPNNDFIVQGLATFHLKNWADGKFIADWTGPKKHVHIPGAKPEEYSEYLLAKLSPLEQTEMLNKAALHYCLADAFHPGCELTWPMRHAELYSEPFRIKRKTKEQIERGEPDYGDVLTSQIVKSADGPVKSGQTAGDLTKWMAIPWHGDTAFCRSGYEPQFGPYLPTFWPARVPNHVLTEADYQIVKDKTLTVKERKEAFMRRGHWMRSFTGPAPEQMLDMIRRFGFIGVVVKKDLEADPALPEVPPVVFVENLPIAVAAAEGAGPFGTPKGTRSPDPVKEAGWESEEQLNEFRRIRGVRPRP